MEPLKLFEDYHNNKKEIDESLSRLVRNYNQWYKEIFGVLAFPIEDYYNFGLQNEYLYFQYYMYQDDNYVEIPWKFLFDRNLLVEHKKQLDEEVEKVKKQQELNREALKKQKEKAEYETYLKLKEKYDTNSV